MIFKIYLSHIATKLKLHRTCAQWCHGPGGPLMIRNNFNNLDYVVYAVRDMQQSSTNSP